MLLEDSTTYQGIIEKGLSQGLSKGRNEGRAQGRTEGRTEGLRSTILRQGTKRFGLPPEGVTAKLLAIHEVASLERLTDRILEAADWDALFGEESSTPE